MVTLSILVALLAGLVVLFGFLLVGVLRALAHFCPRSRRCYRYFTDAQKDCGNNYVVCGRPR